MGRCTLTPMSPKATKKQQTKTSEEEHRQSTGSELKTVNFNVQTSVLDSLEDFSQRTKVPKTHLVRMALDYFLHKLPAKKRLEIVEQYDGP